MAKPKIYKDKASRGYFNDPIQPHREVFPHDLEALPDRKGRTLDRVESARRRPLVTNVRIARAVPGRSGSSSPSIGASGSRDGVGPERAAAPHSQLAHETVVTEDWPHPMATVEPMARPDIGVFLDGRATSVPFTVVFIGPERTTTDNTEAASTCTPSYLRR